MHLSMSSRQGGRWAIGRDFDSLLAQYHNTLLLPPKNLHRHCFRFPLGHLHVPGEIANNDYAKFWGVKRCIMGFVQVENKFNVSIVIES